MFPLHRLGAVLGEHGVGIRVGDCQIRHELGQSLVQAVGSDDRAKTDLVAVLQSLVDGRTQSLTIDGEVGVQAVHGEVLLAGADRNILERDRVARIVQWS